jgi:hypothetical protein
VSDKKQDKVKCLYGDIYVDEQQDCVRLKQEADVIYLSPRVVKELGAMLLVIGASYEWK